MRTSWGPITYDDVDDNGDDDKDGDDDDDNDARFS